MWLERQPPQIFGYCPVWTSTKKYEFFYHYRKAIGPYRHVPWRKFMFELYSVLNAINSLFLQTWKTFFSSKTTSQWCRRWKSSMSSRVLIRDDRGAGVDSGWSCILGWSRSRSQYFSFKPEQEGPESTLRSGQEPIKIFKEPVKIFVMMLAVVKQNAINWDVFSDQCCHISQNCDTGWEYQAFHHPWWF